jgi:hypothetical protein
LLAETDAEKPKSARRQLADLGRMLADAAREHERVQSSLAAAMDAIPARRWCT